MRVVVRICPSYDFVSQSIDVNTPQYYYESADYQTITIYDNQHRANGKSFTVDYIYGQSTTQYDVYINEVQPLVSAALQGEDSMIVLFGHPNSGRKFTFEGPSEHPGIFYRTLDSLFSVIKSSSHHYRVLFSCFQISKEIIKDCLDSRNDAQKLRLKDDAKKGIIVDNLTQLVIRTPQSGLEALNNAKRDLDKSVHTIVSLSVERLGYTGAKKKKVGILKFVSLGVRDPGDDFAKNTWMTSLSNCLKSLDLRQPSIPFHKSKITLLLRECLTGNKSGVILNCLSPTRDNLQDVLYAFDVCKLIRKLAPNFIKNKKGSKYLHNKISPGLKSPMSQSLNSSDQGITRPAPKTVPQAKPINDIVDEVIKDIPILSRDPSLASLTSLTSTDLFSSSGNLNVVTNLQTKFNDLSPPQVPVPQKKETLTIAFPPTKSDDKNDKKNEKKDEKKEEKKDEKSNEKNENNLKIEKLQNVIRALQAELEKHSNKLTNAEQRVKLLEDENKKLHSTIETRDKKIATLQQQNFKLEEQQRNLLLEEKKEDTPKRTINLKDFKRYREVMESSIQNMKNKLNSLEQENETLRKQIRTKDMQLRKEINNQQISSREVQEAAEKNKKLRAIVEDLEQEKLELERVVQAMHEELDYYKRNTSGAEIQNLKEQNHQLELEIERLKQELSKHYQQGYVLVEEEKIQKYESCVNSTMRMIERLRDEIVEKVNILKEKETIIEQYEIKIQNLNEELQQAKEKETKLMNELDFVKKSLAQAIISKLQTSPSRAPSQNSQSNQS